MNAEQQRQISDLELNLQWCEKEQQELNERQEWLSEIRKETESTLTELKALTDNQITA